MDNADASLLNEITTRTNWVNITDKHIGAGSGFTYTDNIFDVQVDDATIQIESNTLSVKVSGIDSTHILDGGIALDNLRSDVASAIMSRVGYEAGDNVNISSGGTDPDTIHIVQGEGSNLDADMLDGYSSEAFAAASSGVCYTVWNGNTCASGWQKVVDGYLSLPFQGYDRYIGSPICLQSLDGLTVGYSSNDYSMRFSLPQRRSTDSYGAYARANNDGVTRPCAIGCK